MKVDWQRLREKGRRMLTANGWQKSIVRKAMTRSSSTTVDDGWWHASDGHQKMVIEKCLENWLTIVTRKESLENNSS